MRPEIPIPTSTPGSRVFAATAAVLVVLLVLAIGLSHQRTNSQAIWEAKLEAALARRPEPDAMRLVLEAMRKINWSSLEANEGLLRQWAGRRTGVADPAIAQLVEKHRPSIVLISRAVANRQATFPSTTEDGLDAARPAFDRFELLGLLLAAGARLDEEAGHPDEALQRALELTRLGAIFCNDTNETSVNHHIIGIALNEIGLAIVCPIVARDSLDRVTLERVRTQLTGIEADIRPISAALAAENASYGREVMGAGESSRRLGTILQIYDASLSSIMGEKLAEELLSHRATFVEEHNRLWLQIETELAKPFPEQSALDSVWMAKHSTNRLVGRHMSGARSLQVRSYVRIAWLRLARTTVELRLNGPSALATSVDPFSSRPFMLRESLLYSVGPDMVDGQGSPTSDDLVVKLP